MKREILSYRMFPIGEDLSYCTFALEFQLSLDNTVMGYSIGLKIT